MKVTDEQQALYEVIRDKLGLVRGTNVTQEAFMNALGLDAPQLSDSYRAARLKQRKCLSAFVHYRDWLQQEHGHLMREKTIKGVVHYVVCSVQDEAAYLRKRQRNGIDEIHFASRGFRLRSRDGMNVQERRDAQEDELHSRMWAATVRKAFRKKPADIVVVNGDTVDHETTTQPESAPVAFALRHLK